MGVNPKQPHFTGQPVRRSEDFALVQGRGCYSDDCSRQNQAYAYVLRSPYAHGRIRAIETEAARSLPGVLGIFVAEDLAAYQSQRSPFAIKFPDGRPMAGNGEQFFAREKVRYVGDPVALIVAESLAFARDAAEAIALDVEVLPAVTEARAAESQAIEPIYPEAPHNIAVEAREGDFKKIDAAFAQAAHVTKLNILSNRVVVCAMEPRAALVEYGEDERFTFHMQSQGVVGMKAGLAGALKIAPERIRVVTGQVGGSFGMKGVVFPEYIALAHAARALKRPIKWTETRADSFLSDHQGRAHDLDAELALSADGEFLAVRVTGYGDLGAYMTPFGVMIGAINILRNIQSVYRTPLLGFSIKMMFTNTPPIGAYRGAGRPEGNYIMERLIETAAREMNIDSIALRQRNHIRADELPYKTAVGTSYDSGDFPNMLARALTAADWAGFESRKRESSARGKLRGRGLGQYLEATAPPMRELGEITFSDDGLITLATGTLDFGQGHATTFAQIIADRLGVPLEGIRLIQGDSDLLRTGGGTGGSKSTMASGTAFVEAAAQVIEKGKRAAGHLLEAAQSDIEFDAGQFRIMGTDRAIGLMELAAKLKTTPKPENESDFPSDLNVSHIHELSPSAYPNGCHVSEVEIDPETGEVEVVRYYAAGDFGNLVNPMIVEGQVHGGVAQALGQALLEHCVFDDEGQFLAGSFVDYALPRADNTPSFNTLDVPTPARTNPLGVKGCGEAGCAGGLPAIMNAVIDALAPFGVQHLNMPATPEKIWGLMHKSQHKRG